MLKQYPTEVKLVYKNYPIAKLHKFAHKAAVAALAAGKQGKYWEYHDELFKIYNKINDVKIKNIATKLGLDMKQFSPDLTNQKLITQVKRDFQEGVQVGVRGTPTILINGQLLKVRSLAGFKAVIEKELKKLKKKK